jgi:hypothetical protein
MTKRYYFKFILEATGESEEQALGEVINQFKEFPGMPIEAWSEPLGPDEWDQAVVDANLAALKYPSIGSETEEFSNTPCYLCRRPLAGARTVLNYVDDEDLYMYYEWVCEDCAMYVAYGEEP